MTFEVLRHSLSFKMASEDYDLRCICKPEYDKIPPCGKVTDPADASEVIITPLAEDYLDQALDYRTNKNVASKNIYEVLAAMDKDGYDMTCLLKRMMGVSPWTWHYQMRNLYVRKQREEQLTAKDMWRMLDVSEREQLFFMKRCEGPLTSQDVTELFFTKDAHDTT